MPIFLVACDLSLVAALHLAIGCDWIQDALSVSLLIVSQCSMLVLVYFECLSCCITGIRI